MAFVPKYQYDIFVSYAHVDDMPDVGADHGWVTTLISSLRTRLAQRLGRSDAFSLWMDPELANHGSLTPQILDALHGSATILIILSPGYLASWWCLREKDSFLDTLQGGSDSRIFLVERDIIDDAERLPRAKNHMPVVSPATGFVGSIYCEKVGTAGVVLGGGREKKEDSVDPAVGLVLHKKVGDPVRAGEPLLTLHYNADARLAEARGLLEAAYTITPEPPAAPGLPP